MKLSDMRNLQAADFAKEIDSRKKELMELRFQAAVGNLAQPHRVKQLRREVAQLNTILSERSKGEQA
ncbi:MULTISPECIES: 50S ribosomal protein L29 [Deinococcus]|jgi:large subunit ribosomal protein L29|uniref:Large ribosomal subunit protein uL29 n=7 Tax=Deinococcus TaxID=1298 RepID=A0A0F7JMQ1_9DEIO|nr:MULTISPECIES: 50S ribosomal protein L29 [Deinococcus]AKH16634.1 50S ribosomal protein L29 [Deinococcus soli (ex Cha et al. 2016)]MDK2013410.1 50S ribosomal protein L29 [Deinococcus sp. 43]MXV21422.1 50S ribosomal protein L29 [Deinococcus xianganensis]NTY00206.1 50S ribosomal protein L29 [Deinococcus sp. JMULE3]RIY15705.1 50S ribosomal protein L29 [Deinococcus sp. RM]